MTEDEAKRWLVDRFGEEAAAKVERFGAMVINENQRQNLISPSTVTTIWTRHLVDSAQLLKFVPATASSWLDIGTGAGFPGIVTSLLFDGRTTLVEPRARRAAFLAEAIEKLGLSGNVNVVQGKTEALSNVTFDIISARAVASAADLLAMTRHLSTTHTHYILPRGRSGSSEVENLSARWHGVFHVEQSITDAASTIIVASGVRS
jgi:16S rRNA (guanine527-N7)-methyltransferase